MNEAVQASGIEQMLHARSYKGFTEAVQRCIEESLAYMFPCYFTTTDATEGNPERVRVAFSEAIRCLFDDSDRVKQIIDELMNRFPSIYAMLLTDIEAAYNGDPAAENVDEIILCYPAFRAISIYRIAHELYLMKLPVIPRAMTENAHRMTGIDIHPGATIADHFFIDHGTGVVIGETTVIGSNVKLYQHVTLGAKSFAVNDDGTLVKGLKRHPNIGNNVVIYAGATILGGNTYIADNSVIGGNVWLTSSTEPGEVVTNGLSHKKKDMRGTV